MARQITGTSLDEIAAAIADELQLDDAESLSVAQITVSVTYQVDRQVDDDWLDDWYKEFQERELVPF